MPNIKTIVKAELVTKTNHDPMNLYVPGAYRIGTYII